MCQECLQRDGLMTDSSTLPLAGQALRRACVKEQEKRVHLGPWCLHTAVEARCPGPQPVLSCSSHPWRLIDQVDFAVIPPRGLSTSNPAKQIQQRSTTPPRENPASGPRAAGRAGNHCLFGAHTFALQGCQKTLFTCSAPLGFASERLFQHVHD